MFNYILHHIFFWFVSFEVLIWNYLCRNNWHMQYQCETCSKNADKVSGEERIFKTLYYRNQ